jgi:hypothetical protein
VRVFLTLNSELKYLITENHLNSNNQCSILQRLSQLPLYTGFIMQSLEVAMTPSSVLNEYLPVGTYLLELEIPDERIVEVLPYNDYARLTEIPRMDDDNLQHYLTCAHVDIPYVEALVVIFEELTCYDIIAVYRESYTHKPWVRCEIIDGKLYHNFG